MAKKIPIRQCVACRKQMPKSQLARIVKTPEGQVLYDAKGKVPGRGAYICKSIECLLKVEKSRGLARALDTEITQDVYALLAKQIEEGGQSG